MLEGNGVVKSDAVEGIYRLTGISKNSETLQIYTDEVALYAANATQLVTGTGKPLKYIPGLATNIENRVHDTFTCRV